MINFSPRAFQPHRRVSVPKRAWTRLPPGWRRSVSSYAFWMNGGLRKKIPFQVRPGGLKPGNSELLFMSSFNRVTAL